MRWYNPIAGWVFLFLLSAVAGFSQPMDRPNMILIIADDVGWNDLGCYGNEAVSTPHMDRIAGEGIRFDNFFLTTSSCSPSRSSIISGRYPHNTGAPELHMPLPSEVAIFPELLQTAGYFTGQAGKWHLGDAARKGFDVIYDKGKENGLGGEDKWIPLLQERPRDKPFFMWFASYDAHRPWGENEFSGTADPGEVSPPPFLADAPATRKDLADYYDEITRLDHFIGQVEKELERQDVSENTVLIIMSDNGRPFPRSKTRMMDSGLKSPFIVKWPEGIKRPGQVCPGLVSAIDIAPGLLELGGVEPPTGFQGRSFIPLLNNPDQDFREYVFGEHNWHDQEAHERMVRTRDFLYVHNSRPNGSNNGPADSNRSSSFGDLKDLRDSGKLSAAQAEVFMMPRPEEELYDVRKDTWQLVNLASVPEYHSRLENLRQILSQWRDDTHDSTPDHLTGDWYDRETGEALDVERVRGEMPGGAEAVRTTGKGPF